MSSSEASFSWTAKVGPEKDLMTVRGDTLEEFMANLDAVIGSGLGQKLLDANKAANSIVISEKSLPEVPQTTFYAKPDAHGAVSLDNTGHYCKHGERTHRLLDNKNKPTMRDVDGTPIAWEKYDAWFCPSKVDQCKPEWGKK